jgi:hypothetical protein
MNTQKVNNVGGTGRTADFHLTQYTAYPETGMLSIYLAGASISVTVHDVTVEQMRSLAFMFSTMAEDIERQQAEAANTPA